MNIRCRSGELAEHLKNNLDRLGLAPEQFDYEITNLTVVPGGLNEDENGVHCANFRYRGVFYLEHLPRRHFALLALLVQNYLDTRDEIREKFALPAVTLEAISLDRGQTVDVDIAVEFVDPAYIVPDPDGPLVGFNGVRYNAGPYDLRIAETLDGIDETIGD